jgi:hypothetical protein
LDYGEMPCDGPINTGDVRSACGSRSIVRADIIDAQ